MEGKIGEYGGPVERLPRIEAFLSQRGEKVKWSARLLEVTLKKKGVLSNKMKEEHHEKIFVIGKTRCFCFRPGSKNSPPKLENEAHILELQEILSGDDSILLTFRNYSLSLIYQSTMDLINALRACYAINFPTRPPGFSIKMDGAKKELPRLKVSIGSCGGYSRTYASFCDFVNVPVCRDLMWDVNNLFELNGTKELNIGEFDLPTSVQMKTIMESLRFNVWFESLVVPFQESRWHPEIIASVTGMTKDNDTLKKLAITGAPTPAPFLQCGRDLAQNKSILQIDFSESVLEDKGLTQFSNDFFALRTVTSIKLSKVGAGPKGISNFFRALCLNKGLCELLTELDISFNKFDADGTAEFITFMGKVGSLQKLNIAGTSPQVSSLSKVDTVNSMQVLDVSHIRCKKETHTLEFEKFVRRFPNLKELNISNTRLQVPSMKVIVTESLAVFNISDNELGDEGLLALTDWILNGRDLANLKTLILDRNFSNRTKTRPKVIENLATILEAFPIKKLSIEAVPGEKGPLRGDLVPFILSLGHNETLEELNVTGNLAGDPLLYALAKVLQTNKSLKSLELDKNAVTGQGLKRFSLGLERNTTFSKMPLPFHDLKVLAENLSEKGAQELEKLLTAIQTRLSTNNGKLGKHREPAVSSIVAEVLADYTASDPRILSLQKGKSVTIISVLSKEWWRVEYEGQIGIAPANHLKLPSKKSTKRGKENQSIMRIESTRIDLDPKLRAPKMDTDTRIGIQEGRVVLKPTGIIDEKGTVKAIHMAKEQRENEKTNENKFEGEAVVLYDYDAEEPRMLSLKKGKIAKILDKSFSKDWWKVLYEGKVGLVPSNHMKVLTNEEKAEVLKKEKEEQDKLERQRQEELAKEEHEAERKEKEKKKQEVENIILEKAKKRKDLLSKEEEEKKMQEKVKAADGKVFGVPLSVLVTRDGEPIPKFLTGLLKALKKSFDEQGLFRVPGTVSNIKQIQADIDGGTISDFKTYFESKIEHDLASLLKNFLRELPEPTIDNATYLKMRELIDNRVELPDFSDKLLATFSNLSKENCSLLETLLSFLVAMSMHASKNLMNLKNLSLVFGPCLLREVDDIPDLESMGKFSETILILLETWDEMSRKGEEEESKAEEAKLEEKKEEPKVEEKKEEEKKEEEKKEEPKVEEKKEEEKKEEKKEEVKDDDVLDLLEMLKKNASDLMSIPDEPVVRKKPKRPNPKTARYIYRDLSLRKQLKQLDETLEEKDALDALLNNNHN